MPNVWCVMGACDVVICVVCLWCAMLWCWHQTVYLQLAITNWYFDTISHRTLSMWARGDNRIHGNMSWELDWRHETPVTSIWMPGSHQSQSLPSCTDHTRPPLSSQCVQHSNFSRGGGVSKGCGERAIVVTFFSNKNCIIAEWAGALAEEREWGEFVGNLDRVCGEEKNFADVLIKNLATKLGRKNIF